MSRPGSAAILAVSLMLAGPTLAAPIENAVSMRARSAPIPDQPYYPPGYRALRIAAAAQVAASPRPRKVMLTSFPDEPVYYDLIDCDADYIVPEGVDPLVSRFSDLARDVERIAGELRRLGYAAEIYEGPLREHERAALAEILREAKAAGRGEEPLIDDNPYEALYPLAAAMEKSRARLQPRKPPIKAEGGCGG
jgi:hypothetical protein